MASASLFILGRSARNRLRVRLRRLREPRYLIGALFGFAYLTFTFIVRERVYSERQRGVVATTAAGAEIITVAIRRINIGQDPHAPNLLDAVPPSRYTILPNTAGCYTAKDAVYTLQLARELLDRKSTRLNSSH